MEKRLSNTTLWMLSVVLLVASLVLLVGLAEGLVRVRQWVKYGTLTNFEDLLTVDPKLNMRVPVAGKSLGPISINSLGFRGPEIEVPKPLDRYRIAFMGASSTYCTEVSGNDKTWPHLTVSGLPKVFPGVSFDYINAGVPGIGVSTITASLRHRVLPLQPDAVILYDFGDLSPELLKNAREQGIFQGAGANNAWQKSWLAKHLLLWELVEKNLQIKESQAQVARSTKTLRIGPTFGEGLRAELREFVNIAKANGRFVALTTYSTQVRPEQSASRKLEAAASGLYFAPFMTPDGLLEAYSRYNKIIREVAGETGAALIENENDIPGDSEHFADNVHFKDKGAVSMANRMVAALARNPLFIQAVQERPGAGAH